MFAIFLHRVAKKLSEFLIQNPIKRAMHKPESCIICSNKFEPSTSLSPTLIGHSLNCCIALLVMKVMNSARTATGGLLICKLLLACCGSILCSWQSTGTNTQNYVKVLEEMRKRKELKMWVHGNKQESDVRHISFWWRRWVCKLSWQGTETWFSA